MTDNHMGLTWVTQLPLLCFASLTTISLILYVAYMLTPQLSTTTVKTSYMSLGISSNNNSVLDLIRGVPAKQIYESGHTNFSSNICPELGENFQLFIVITSAPRHVRPRMTIRQTWGHFANRRNVSIAFMLGSTRNSILRDRINQEELMYGDIIRGRFIDTYENLTLKTISMLEWVKNYCPNAFFVLKTDDDMFINIPLLLKFISKHNPKLRVIYGYLAKNWKPIRNETSKYYISLQQYQPAVFPDFTTGPAYLFPARLSKDLYSAALNHTYFKLEDVFLTGIVANDLKIERIHVPEFLNRPVLLTSYKIQQSISIHMVKRKDQFFLWKELLDGRANRGVITVQVWILPLILLFVE